LQRILLVPHTHWDRAWYLPFEAFRHRLVRFIDQLLSTLESDESFLTFTLDGQTVVLDDYLEIRPENRSRIEKLVREKRIEIGPWYTLPDLMLSSGESIIRNIEMGLKQANEFGGAMAVGYVPDPFGHPAELPQILSGFGLNSFVFMRGMPKNEKKRLGTNFVWQSASGAKVRVLYQVGGYLDGSALGYPEQWGRNEGYSANLENAVERLQECISRSDGSDVVLVSNGCDHMPIQEELPSMVKSLNQKGISVEISTFAHYFQQTEGRLPELPVYRGDLLGNVDHPVLSSVWSTHIRLKQLNRESEKILTRYLEPIQYLFRNFAPDQRKFNQALWKKLFKNQAHDDICGCSTDDVHKEDEVRFKRILTLSESLILENLESFLLLNKSERPIEELATTVFAMNPHPFLAKSKVRLEILIPNPKGEFADPTPESSLVVKDQNGLKTPVKVFSSTPRTVRSRFLETTWGRSYDVEFEVELAALQASFFTIEETGLSPTEVIPQSLISGFGYELSVKDHHLVLSSELSSRVLADFISFEWEEDLGDTYSASITPSSGVKSKLHRILPTKRGISAFYEIRFDRNQSSVSLSPFNPLLVRVDFSVSTSSGLDMVVHYENTLLNGRLRVLIDPGVKANQACADGHFQMVRHNRTPLKDTDHAPASYPGELEYDTKHQGEFVIVGEDELVWVANRGHAEFELTDHGLAITLHRSIGMLSVAGGRLRGCQAGPSIPTPYAQVLGTHRHEFSIGFGKVGLNEAAKYARQFSTPVYALEAPFLRYVASEATLKSPSSLASWQDPRIVLSSLREKEGQMEIRLYNQSSDFGEFTLNLPGIEKVKKIALDGRVIADMILPTEGLFSINFVPSEIITLRSI
jgi:mannosylglycerate hydrolase